VDSSRLSRIFAPKQALKGEFMNPLLQSSFNTPFEASPFDKTKPEHFIPALKQRISEAKQEIEKIKAVATPTFTNVIEALERADHEVGTVAGIFFNLHSAETSDELQKVAKKFSPMLTEFGNDITLDEVLFSKVKAVYENRSNEKLDGEQLRLLDKTYKSFARNGALLSEDKKNQLREIDKKLSGLSLAFGDNVLADTNEFKLTLTDEAELAGLPDSAKEAAAFAAKEAGLEGQWLFTLNFPSYIPFMTYSSVRELREKMYRAYASRGAHEGQRDNRPFIKEIVELRFERAKLLGYKTHAEYVLEERMAERPETVHHFLTDLYEAARPAGEKELAELREFATKIDGLSDLKPWDMSYYSEKLKQQKYSFDEELLKPYFKLENVIEGIFTIAKKLHGLSFKPRTDIPVYHKDVHTYEVLDAEGNHVSLFYADFFPRSTKRGGAWMTSFRDQSIENGVNKRPHVAIVCNFTKPTDTKPSLLTFDEVLTFLHEFGHALHGILANSRYQSLSGTNVYWDFVELPSQIMENWAYEKEFLDLFARHYQTGEAIPAEYIQKIRDAATFQEGRATLRQVCFALVDMKWHDSLPSSLPTLEEIEREAIVKTTFAEPVEGTSISSAFSHIFQGGYSAGYYSYKWAEVLDADAFELFKEKGIFDPETAKSFRENILSKGGSEHPMELFKKFRGREPDPKALLRRAGLIQA
jgi:peptidyl-dipeptidase Dcp